MATKKRLILLDHALQAVSENYRSDMPKHELDVLIATRKRLKAMPTVDAVEVVHGHTIPADQPKKVLLDRKCRICDSLMLSTDAYCPNCGAKMDGAMEGDSNG